jgi:hypothetical protein
MKLCPVAAKLFHVDRHDKAKYFFGILPTHLNKERMLDIPLSLQELNASFQTGIVHIRNQSSIMSRKHLQKVHCLTDTFHHSMKQGELNCWRKWALILNECRFCM